MEPIEALFLPHPLQGHVNPLLQLSHRLASSHGVSITFVVTEHLLSRMTPHASLPIKLVGVSDNLPPDHPRQSTFLHAYEAVMGMEASVDKLLQDRARRSLLPSFIVADTFVCWANRLALKYGIPYVAMAITNAAALAVLSSVQKLLDLGVLPLKTVKGSSKYVDELITCIPGLPPLHPLEIPESMRSAHYRVQYIREQFAEAANAVVMLVNSATELERSVLEGLEFQVPTFCIGPGAILNGESSSVEGVGASFWPEEEDCLLWLDKQASDSVLYVSFGSVALLSSKQVAELARGLEASEQPFLWVIRPGSTDASPSEILPDGFLKRTKGRGLIVSWCPQLRVLSHRATGCFLTHCGWNSVAESICLGGVPMICWPVVAEQALNARMIVDVWKVGLGVATRDDDDDFVRHEEVTRVVRAVMQGDGAEQFKCRVAEMRETAKRAVQEGGSSSRNIEKVLEIVTNANKPRKRTTPQP